MPSADACVRARAPRGPTGDRRARAAAPRPPPPDTAHDRPASPSPSERDPPCRRPPCKEDDSARTSGAKADPNAATEKDLTVAFLPKQVSNPYFTVADKGGEKALKQLGPTYKETGPNSATDTSGQVGYVTTLTQQQVDAMAVSAQDPGALCTALRQAMTCRATSVLD